MSIPEEYLWEYGCFTSNYSTEEKIVHPLAIIKSSTSLSECLALLSLFSSSAVNCLWLLSEGHGLMSPCFLHNMMLCSLPHLVLITAALIVITMPCLGSSPPLLLLIHSPFFTFLLPYLLWFTPKPWKESIYGWALNSHLSALPFLHIHTSMHVVCTYEDTNLWYLCAGRSTILKNLFSPSTMGFSVRSHVLSVIQ